MLLKVFWPASLMLVVPRLVEQMGCQDEDIVHAVLVSRS